MNIDRSKQALPSWIRRAVSVALVLHISAIFIAPLSGPPPASQLSAELMSVAGPYVEAIHQNHGYRFFAPSPGDSHLIHYELETVAGDVVQGQFPDPKQHWPRLLYHRHFMLSEFANSVLPPQIDQTGQAVEMPADAMQIFNAYFNSYAQHLLDEHGGRQVTLKLIRHMIPSPQDVVLGQKLDDPESFVTLHTQTFQRSQP